VGLKAYYNAGSAALVLLLVLLAIGTFLWCKMGRRRVQLPFSKISSEEESIPLNSDIGRSDQESGTQRLRKGKGKETERGMGVQEEAIFEVGDSDDEEGYRTETKGHSASWKIGLDYI
jgi:carboxypeptidase D